MSELARIHVFVSGRVQGVSYRESAREAAERIGVVGWIRNLPDGRVEAVLEGSTEQVREMLDYLRRGPAPARVDHLEEHHEPAAGDLTTFEVLRGNRP